MDVNSIFMNWYINEKPSIFEDGKKPHHIYKLVKAMYELKQVPRAWYERLNSFLVDTTLFKMAQKGHLLIMTSSLKPILKGCVKNSKN
ncbi:hypothetical protein CR513_27337, partial [Mucuna pruriens]